MKYLNIVCSWNKKNVILQEERVITLIMKNGNYEDEFKENNNNKNKAMSKRKTLCNQETKIEEGKKHEGPNHKLLNMI